MNRNSLQNVIEFIFKYIWLFCAVLAVLEVFSTGLTAGLLLEQSTRGVLYSASGEVSGRVDGVLRLLNGFATNEELSDTSVPLYDRAIQTESYRLAYNLFMIAFCDEDVNVVSSDTTERPTEFVSLAYRDYMQRLYSTGEPQITDAFLSGADNVTLNYTIAVPIMKEGKVQNCVFGSIYFQDIQDRLSRDIYGEGRHFYLLGRENTIMVGDDDTPFGEPFENVIASVRFLTSGKAEMLQNFSSGTTGEYWEWAEDGLCYVSYQRVAPTQWTIVYRAEFFPVLASLLPTLLCKILFYVLLCAAVSLLGRRYLRRHLGAVNHLLDRVSLMQKELFQTEQLDYENLLELTQQGLSDQLTGLSTRVVLFNKMILLTTAPSARGAVFFLDLDDLKRINDTFGHEAGDMALLHFAKKLKEFEQKYRALAARYGGDEFILVVDSISRSEVMQLASELCASLNTTLTLKNRSLAVHGSIGVALYPEHGIKPEELISKADFALYTAKQNGKNMTSVYSDDSEI